MLGRARRAWRRAKGRMFERHLLLTNLALSAALSGAGDVLLQEYALLRGEREARDTARSRRMALSGLAGGFLAHHWYDRLDRLLPGTSLSAVLKKVAADQILFSPVYIAVFFLTVGFLENSPLPAVAREILDKGSTLYAAEWVVWPPAQIVNFYFLPTKYRVLYDNTVSLGYDIYTSHVKHDSKTDGKVN